MHPRVASAVNDLGAVALRRGNYDEAEAAFTRMGDIYKIGIRHEALSHRHRHLEHRQRVHRAQGPQACRTVLSRGDRDVRGDPVARPHLNTGIGRIKLGSALVGQERYAEAEKELLAGYEILMKQTSPSVSWLKNAREDLVKLYTASNQPEKAKKFQTELQN